MWKVNLLVNNISDSYTVPCLEKSKARNTIHDIEVVGDWNLCCAFVGYGSSIFAGK
jgi:hypothetical protein